MEFLFGILAILSLFSSLSAQTNSVTYTSLSPDTVIRNPERGLCNSDHYFYASLPNLILEPASLQRAKANNMSIAYTIFYLDTFFNSSISDSVLTRINTSFTTLRNNGFKAVVRFAYNHNESLTGYLDATKDRILGHIDQLKALLVQNVDVILLVQTGFVGIWGEWHTSNNFGNYDDNKNVTITAANYADRRAVSDALLAALPPTRMIQQRYAVQKRIMYNRYTPLQESEAYSGSNIARIGHHNQCFLATDSDGGTYKQPSVDIPYLAQETKYVPQGGETCGIDPGRTTCDTALLELARNHWSYIDIAPNINVDPALKLLQDQGCLTTIGNRLGYRFQLISSVFPTSAKSNSQISVQINLNNTGFAAPFNPRVVYLVLKNSASQYSFKLSSNPNFWLPGNIVINENVSLSSVNPGTYKMYLNLPDSAPTLSSIVDYSIRFANVGTWDSTTGLNDLTQTIIITN